MNDEVGRIWKEAGVRYHKNFAECNLHLTKHHTMKMYGGVEV
jgi:hypothetical protein